MTVVGRFLEVDLVSPGGIRKSFEFIFICLEVVPVADWSWPFIFRIYCAEFLRCLVKFLDCAVVLAASYIVEDRKRAFAICGVSIGRLLRHGIENAPFDHRDLHGVIQAEARRPRHKRNSASVCQPRQRHESRKTHEGQDGAMRASADERNMKVLLGSVDQNQWRSRAETTENTAK